MTTDSATDLLPTLRYTVRQIPIRDELVLKSMVALASGRARHGWSYVGTLDADLLILGTQSSPQEGALTEEETEGIHILPLVPAGAARLDSLYLPLRWHDVLRQLDACGEAILGKPGERSRRTRPAPRERSEGALHGGHGTQDGRGRIPNLSDSATSRFSLVRWPRPSILGLRPEHAKLTAVLSLRPHSVAELAKASGVALSVCETFIELLLIDDSVRTIARIPVAPSAETHTPGPGSATANEPREESPGIGAALGQVTHGLIDRIRAKLKLPPRSAEFP